jgi:hypothetical protein
MCALVHEASHGDEMSEFEREVVWPERLLSSAELAEALSRYLESKISTTAQVCFGPLKFYLNI